MSRTRKVTTSQQTPASCYPLVPRLPPRAHKSSTSLLPSPHVHHPLQHRRLWMDVENQFKTSQIPPAYPHTHHHPKRQVGPKAVMTWHSPVATSLCPVKLSLMILHHQQHPLR